MIRVLEQGHCVQYQRDGGWRVGHVMKGMSRFPTNRTLVRECQTGELVEVPTIELDPYPLFQIPEPGVEVGT